MSKTKTVLITGASKGIGLTLSDFYKDSGYQVIAPTRDEMDLSSLASIQSYLSNSDHQVDILINNAGINNIAAIESMSIEQWQQILQVNLNAAFLLTQHYAQAMAKRKWGRITNISSCFALVSKAGRSAYTASKAALIGLTKTSAIEFAEHNVLVNAVCPGFIETEMTHKNNNKQQIQEICKSIPLGRLASPKELIGLVEYLNSEKNTYLTGQAVVIDGAFTIQ